MKRGRNQRRRQGMNPNRALDSNGPDVRIRGTANQIYDKYQALARDASSSGDRVKAENYLQHAEHYFRLIRAMQPERPPAQDADQQTEGAEQPSENEARNTGGGQERRPRSNGAGKERNADEAQDTAAKSEAPADDQNSDDTSVAASSGDEEPRKPRRKRRPRAPKAEASEDSSESPATDEALA